MILKDLRNELKVTLGQLVDDQRITDLQIDYWIKVAADALRYRMIAAQGLEDQRRSGAYLRRFVVDVLHDNEAIDKSCQKYITLPSKIYDYELDGAVDYMAYYSDGECDGCPPRFTRVIFARTTPASTKLLYGSSYQKPSPSNPYFYRIDDRLYLLGVAPMIEQVEVGLFTSLPDIRTIDPDAPLPIDDALLTDLRRMVIENARVMLIMPEPSRINDGNSGQGDLSLPKQVSVNDPSVAQ